MKIIEKIISNEWKKIISGDKRRKRQILKENSCPIRSQLATRKKKKLGRLNLHETGLEHMCYEFACAFLGVSRLCAGPLGIMVPYTYVIKYITYYVICIITLSCKPGAHYSVVMRVAVCSRKRYSSATEHTGA